MTSREDTASALLALARRAAAVVLRYYEKPIDVRYKGKGDPVTDADHAANALIVEALSAAYPGVPIVAEESDPETYAGYTVADRAFFVDPLDGTRDFVKRNDEFAVMIGLAEAGRATLGVIVLPVGGRAFVGGVGLDAVDIAADGTRRPLRVSSVSDLAHANLVVSRSRRQPSLDEAARELGVGKVTICGSAGVKAVRVAAGEADIYAQPGHAGKLWDSCAPEAVVEAAGGKVSDTLGGAFDYRGELENRRGFLATNARLYDRAKAMLREAQRKRDEKP